MHSIQGIGAGFIPKNLDLNVIDEVYLLATHQHFNIQKFSQSTKVLQGGYHQEPY